jgi:ArsR family transcriptional regulator, arsenate/arsenite/antimonite-responsive transcriptional repressor
MHSVWMKMESAILALRALGHQGRFEVVRLLVRAGEAGLSAGDIARATRSLPNTLTMNMNVLSRAGLVRSRRAGRWIIYTAAFDRLSELMVVLTESFGGGAVRGEAAESPPEPPIQARMARGRGKPARSAGPPTLSARRRTPLGR